MPVYEDADPGIKSMKGLHVYHYFMSNCASAYVLHSKKRARTGRPTPSTCLPGKIPRTNTSGSTLRDWSLRSRAWPHENP